MIHTYIHTRIPGAAVDRVHGILGQVIRAHSNPGVLATTTKKVSKISVLMPLRFYVKAP